MSLCLIKLIQYSCFNIFLFRFLETEEFTGEIEDGVLTKTVHPKDALRLWCGAVGEPQPSVIWTRENARLPPRSKVDGQHLLVSPFELEDEVIYRLSLLG